MFNRSEILKAAWARYRDERRFAADPNTFSRKAFAKALRMAWADAKLMADILAQQAERKAARAAKPEVAAVRDEVLMLDMKDRWSPTEWARRDRLQNQLSAIAA